MLSLDAEEIVVSWLNSILPEGWEAFGDKPSVVPAQYVLVDRTGGAREAMVLDRASILIEVYHKDSRVAAKNQAMDIADRIIELVAYAPNLTHASINSVINLDDTLTQTHRYGVYCDIYCRR
jgi:hypothetical protein